MISSDLLFICFNNGKFLSVENKFLLFKMFLSSPGAAAALNTFLPTTSLHDIRK